MVIDTVRLTSAVLAASIVLVGAMDAGAKQPGKSPTSLSIPAPKPANQDSSFANPTEDQQRAYAEAERKRATAEKDLYGIRAKFFQSTNPEIRQVGISRLREYTDAAIFPLMLSIFKNEKPDVRNAILDHLADQKTEDADAVLAWAAVFDKTDAIRAGAAERLKKRVAAAGAASRPVQYALLKGLQSNENEQVKTAGQLSYDMKLYEMLPAMIAGQVSGTSIGAGGMGADDGTSLGWILVGRQVSYVQDLIPVVGNGAVAFDPQIGVVTEGCVIRVIDANVYVYRYDLHQQLIGLADEGSGQSTAHMGWDQAKWMKWYTDEFVPYRAKLKAEAQKQQEAVVRRGGA